MRVDRLDLMAYGSFTDTSLDLSEGEYGLHLIYGDNEAGKSTSLRALIALLFGIPTRTKDSFFHTNAQLRIGGKLSLSDGKEIEFLRRKGTKGTLLKYGTDDPLDDAILTPFLPGGIDENLFTKLWGIDHGRLISGGQELLAQSGDLGQALFSAAVGTANFRDVLTTLQKSAEDIFKPRGSKATLNQSITHFRDAQKRMKDASLPVADWKKLQKDLTDTDAAIEQVENKIEVQSKMKSRLERVKRVKGALAQRGNILVKIDELGPVLLLPVDFEEKRKSLTDMLQRAGEKKKRLETKLDNLNKELEVLNVRHELLENEDRILMLYKELGAVEKTLKDRPQQDGKRRLLRNESESLLKSVRPDIGLDQVDSLRPLLNNKKWISGLAQKHRLLTQKKDQAEKTLRDIKDEQKSLSIEYDLIPQSQLDLKALKATIASVRKAGDVEQRLSDTHERVVEERASCENERKRLGRFSGTIESLLNLAMPVSETVDMFEKEYDELSEKRRDAKHKQRDVKEEMKLTEQELKTLLLRSDVPTISELEDSREVRNRGWRLIKNKYIDRLDSKKDPSKCKYDHPPDSDLVTTYEQNIHHTDHLSDRLRLAADHVVKRADLETRIEIQQSRIDAIEESYKKIKNEQRAFQERWTIIWEPLGIEPGTPREMKQWLLRVNNLVEKVQAANAITQEEQNLNKKCEQLKKVVSPQIDAFDTSINHQKMSLETMISLCEQRVEEEAVNRERRHQIEQSQKEANIRLKRTEDEITAIDADTLSWLQEWSQAIDGLGLKADVHPEHATETLDQLVSVFDTLDKSEELRKRIFGMDQVEQKFEKNVFEFVETIGFKGEDHHAAAVAAYLHRDLSIAREARASLIKTQAQIKELKVEIEDTDITIQSANDQLLTLKTQSGVDSNDEMLVAGERSHMKREYQKNLAMLEQELNRNGDGHTIEELEKECGDTETDSLEGELDKINLELKDFQTQRDRLRDQRQSLQHEINSKDGSTLAANASEEAEEHRAAMISHAEHYLRLHIAALILEQRIEDYRRKNQTPLLARAGTLFSKLTAGSYAGLRDELDDTGKPILLGVRSDDKEVAVYGMSDGSRDQLYLALRLATLEQHLSKSEPIPFIVDDILIGFDDRRSRVCLEVLAELARSTQVLLFTHHHRILELAESIEAKAGMYPHYLR